MPSLSSQRKGRGKYERVATDERHTGSSDGEETFQTVQLSSGDSNDDGVDSVKLRNNPTKYCSAWKLPRSGRASHKQHYTFMEDLLDINALPAKIHYLLMNFGGGFLVPFLPVYYRQLGLTVAQGGVLLSLPYFISFWAAPLWSGLADKYRSLRLIFVLTLLSYGVFHTCLYAVPTSVSPPGACLKDDYACRLPLNSTHTPDPPHTSSVYSLSPSVNSSTEPSAHLPVTSAMPEQQATGIGAADQVISTGGEQDQLSSPGHTAGRSGLQSKNVSSVPTIDSNARTRAFILATFLVALAHLFGGALQNLSDAAVLKLVDSGKQSGESRYGKQRLWGAAGYALGSAVSGSWAAAADANSCGEGEYAIHFTGFMIFIALSAVISGICLFPARHTPQSRGKALSHAQQESVNVMSGLRMIFSRPRPCAVFLAVFSLAVARGCDFFLVWFLKELCASESLVGWSIFMIAGSEVPMFLFSDRIIARLGHFRTLYVVFALFVVRISFYTMLTTTNVGWVLPLEMLRGLAFSLVWSCAVQYARRIATPDLETTFQGILGGIWYGIGAAFGGVFGGIIYQQQGARVMFGLSAGWCAMSALLFAGSQFLIDRRESTERLEAEQNDFVDSDDNIEFDQANVRSYRAKDSDTSCAVTEAVTDSHNGSNGAQQSNGQFESDLKETSLEVSER
ncbi:major facilitator superfamily domain-containing protein 6-like [Sycon ciliatum]|uniref:major facilitator superfamily domain-containing protein 6-like n=1 Tax=Sycon ciliatum TaxID=27933 RepID=UPI0020AB15A9|eukprot:scpid43594/ scgid32041/ Major facilitator superfamily domain-containing protein 6; Macrophage MHC class I receptor 2